MMKLLKYNTASTALAFSTMRGKGKGAYGGFNITHYCGDTTEHVVACRSELCSHLGIDDSRLILPRQTHSCNVLCIDNEFMQLPPQQQATALHGVDAVITALKDVCIGVSTADCIPVLLHDNKRGVVAAVHAGWRGTVAGITAKCVKEMQNTYGCESMDIGAVIAPGISIDAFEVGDEVYEAFDEAGFPMERMAKRYPAATGGEKWHIDLWEANRFMLEQCGIGGENIQTTGICTFKRHEEFFSARKLGINSGRIFSGIILR